MPTYSIYLDQGQDAKVRNYAKQKNVSPAKAVRMILDEWIESKA
jgi:hypothetical protein